MLLRYLYDLAVSRCLLDDPAFAQKAVRWILELDAEGNLIGSGPQITGDEKRGKEFSCPQTTRSKNGGGISEFLAEGFTAVFGLDLDPEDKITDKKRVDRNVNNEKKSIDFWRQINEAAHHIRHKGLEALLKFRERNESNLPTYFRWGKSNDIKTDTKSTWWVRGASGNEIRLDSSNFTFKFDGELLLENETIRQFWRDTHARDRKLVCEEFSKGFCLISGRRDQSLAPTHYPKIQGVPNTPSYGAAIVSFDKDAFSSYGFDQSLNAPTSVEVATAYCIALNWLLKHPDHSIRLGPISYCFWVKESQSSSSFFARLLNDPDPQVVSQFLKSPWSGIERDFARRDQFFTVTISGNGGRIVVRHWLQQSLDQAIDHFFKWFSDLKLFDIGRPFQPKNGMPPLAIFRLACTTVREAKDLRSDILAQLYHAALEGKAPSISLLKPILNQLHSRLVSDKDYKFLFDESCFSMIKLILNRNKKETDMEIKPELTADTNDPAYNCGRLLAVFDDLQKRAHDWKLQGPTIAERYFSSASTSPMMAFAILWKLHFHHLKKLSRIEGAGQAAAAVIKKKLTDICALFHQTDEMRQISLPPELPRTLDLQAQGRFALGFYQQAASDYANKQLNLNKSSKDNLESEVEINHFIS